MAHFEIEPRLPLPAALQEVFFKELRSAIGRLTEEHEDEVETVHRFRVAMKRCRSLLRLVRSGMARGAYSGKNEALRDAARALSVERDRTVLVQVVQDVLHEVSGDAASSLRQLSVALADPGQVTLDSEERRARIQRAVHLARGVLEAPLDLQEEDSLGWLLEGFHRSYRRGRTIFDHLDFESNEQVHELRKAAKVHRYQLGLLRPFFPPVLAGQEKAVKKLGKALGSIHDLDVLRAHVLDLSADILVESDRRQIFQALAQRRQIFCQKADARARLVFAESPRSMSRRVKKYIHRTDAR